MAQAGTPAGGQVIWSRTVEHDKIADRWRKLGLFFGLPSAIALLAALIFGGFGAFLGVLILVALSGFLVGGMVFFQNLSAKMGQTIELVDGHLVFGKRKVELARLEAWTTVELKKTIGVSQQAIWGNPMAGNAITAKALFRLADLDENGERGTNMMGGPGFEVIEFAWAEMGPEQLHELRKALEPHLFAPWVEPGTLRNN